MTFVTGTLDYGQGHASPFAQVLSSRLGVPFDRIRLVQSDSDELVFGAGTGGSRSMMMSGAAIVQASDLVIKKGRQLAAEALEAAAADIEFRDGRFVVAGTDRAIGLMELAAKLRAGMAVPEGLPKTLDVTHVTEVIPSAFPNGCHVCEVEIDPETGEVEVVRYSSVNDFGTIVNPLLVEGQIHGGVVQGMGQASWRRCSTTRPASSSPARSWTTRCRARPTCRRRSASQATRCRRRPTRSARRAAARPAARARSFR